MSTQLVLVHGIGAQQPGERRRALLDAFARLGEPDVHVLEYNWNDLSSRGADIHVLSGAWLEAAVQGCSNAMTGARGVPHRLYLGLSFVAPFLVANAVALAVTAPPTRPILGTVLECYATTLVGLAVLCIVVAPSDERVNIVRYTTMVIGWPLVYLFTAGLRALTSVLLFSGLFGLSLLAAASCDARYQTVVDDSDLTAAWTKTCVVLVGLGAFLAFLERGAGPLLRTLADLALYIGSRNRRARTLSGLQAVLSSLDDNDVILAGHSLGSVISVDALRSPSLQISSIRSLTLVTGGSPLHRWLRRFFPQFTPALDETAARLNGRFPRFRWINVYRPLDPVGGALKSDQIVDVSTRQRTRFHSNYWSDDVVVGQVTNALAKSTESSGKAGTDSPFTPPWSEVSSKEQLSSLLEAIAALGIVSPLFFPVVTTVLLIAYGQLRYLIAILSCFFLLIPIGAFLPWWVNAVRSYLGHEPR